MNRLLLIILVLIAQAIPATAESREKDLDRWVDRELIPHVKHPLQGRDRDVCGSQGQRAYAGK
jgi:hypothetical protein